ncbi:MAG: hypothetical protein A2W99_15345 [Bacteroidetes bacterium GWF2_33_16]|nr:MAG: hypothetical protein A2X00_09555 [Bacteroidetes bacterium GWE2_32_14]OFY07695.1 MAG: hypothetical protein A2W99_15345 [Bacteroidetes bacterium GWF2_33_16]
MKNPVFNKLIVHISIVFIFLLLSFIYNSPILEKKEIFQSDHANYQGVAKEIIDFESKGEETQWTNSIFGGMPAYLIKSTSKSIILHVHKLFTLNNFKPVSYVFLYLIGAYIAFLLFGINPWISFIGAVAFAFSSYNFIIIAAGHNTKAMAIGYLFPIIAGIYASYNGRHLLGAIIVALFLALQLFINHLQITYYTLLIALIYGLVELIYAIKEKAYLPFLKATGVLIIAAILALGSNFGQIWTTYEYGKYSIRGKSELTHDQENKTSGLDKDYATAWSYGIDETLTLLIPNFKGGSSGGEVGKNSASYEFFKSVQGERYASQVIKQLPLYWGSQPFTSGPVYVGAIIVFLFVFGLFVVDRKTKWWLVSATVLSIVLAWGNNIKTGDLFFFLGIGFLIYTVIEYLKTKKINYFLSSIFIIFFVLKFFISESFYNYPFNYFVLDYLPGYNKFRTVSMILVIAQVTMPLLAILALKKIFDGSVQNQQLVKILKNSLYIVGGICLFFALLPGLFFSFTGVSDQTYIQQGAQAFVDALRDDRKGLLRMDAIRSLIYILLATGVLFAFIKKKIKSNVFIISLVMLILVDLWMVDKRYFNNDNFVSKKQANEPFQMTQADMQILQDKDPNFRVLNVSVNTFNNASTAYFHKSIGGYHGAKMKRYQELIDFHIMKNNMDVLNMLNTKYFIVPDDKGQPIARMNPGALGNAWFVENYRIVPNADAEIEALSDFDPAKEAIIDQRYDDFVAGKNFGLDSSSYLKLISYKPNQLVYSTNCKAEQLAVFSEIYYPKGWNAFIDGNLAPHFSVNYVLRAMVVPAGQHEIEFRFEPRSYFIGNKVSLASSIILLLGVLLILGREIAIYLKKD